MCKYLQRVGATGVIAACLAVTAMADPPEFKSQSRGYINTVEAQSCDEVVNGVFCRHLNAWENFDVKGTFQSIYATIYSWRQHYDPSDGSWSSGSRYLSCPIDREALSVDVHGAQLETTLDPQGIGCYSTGYITSWDPINGEQTVPWSYPGPMVVTGEWADPFSYSKSVLIENGTYYDGWTGMTSKYGQQCNRRWGEWMRSGGFSIGARSWEFAGPEGSVWSQYYLGSCNDRLTQR